MNDDLLWFAVALGCIWHGAQIVWVAPALPSQFYREKPDVDKGSAAAFNLFWIDQYAWIGIALCALGVCIVLWRMLT